MMFKDRAAFDAKVELTFITNYMTPYQAALFGGTASRVLVCQAPDERRKWSPIHVENGVDISNFSLMARVRAVCKSVHGANHVLVGSPRMLECIVAIILARATKLTFALWLERPRKRLNMFRRLTLRSLLGKRGSIACIGYLAQEAYRASGLDPSKLWVMPYSYGSSNEDTSLTREPPRRDTESGLRILFLGSEPYRKGADVLISAHEALPASLKSRIVIGLAGFDRVSKTDEGNILNLGFIEPDDVSDLLREYDMLALPARYEGWGVVAEEAMRSGLPVIATEQVGSVGWLVVDGYSGLVCRAGSVRSLIEAMTRLLQERGLYDRLARGAAERVEWHERNSSFTRLIDLFDEQERDACTRAP